MDSLFWERAHGGLTHFPIAFVFGAAFFDTLAFLRRPRTNGPDYHVIGYWLMGLGVVGSFGAVPGAG